MVAETLQERVAGVVDGLIGRLRDRPRPTGRRRTVLLVGAALLFHVQLITTAQVGLSAVYLACVWMFIVWVFAEQEDESLNDVSLELCTKARELADQLGVKMGAVRTPGRAVVCVPNRVVVTVLGDGPTPTDAVTR